MKKRIIAILAVVLMCFTTLFGGCGLITIDEQKDMAQVIATVKISEDVPTTRSQIKKRHLIMDYISYGYYYVVNGEKTQNEVIDMIVENQVGTEIILQSIMQELNEDENFVKNTGYGKWEVERYLTKENKFEGEGENKVCTELSEIDEAKYNALYALNGLIESYIEKEEEPVGDTNPEEVRAIPTNATNEEKELTDDEKYKYIQKGLQLGEVGSKERKAYNKFIKFAQTNNLLGNTFVNNNFATSTYYEETISSYIENALLEKYEELYKNKKRAELSFEELGEKYAEMYEAQKFGFDSNSSNFESALSSATASAPIIYSPYGGYAYVYNLLIGVNEEQSKAIEKLKTEYKTDSKEYKAGRREILQSITAKDLRSTWILSGYDYDFAKNKFTGDYTFLENLEDSYAFQGTVTCLKEKDGDKPAEYRIDSIVEFGLNDFIKEINKYVYNKEDDIEPSTTNPEVYYEYNSNGQPANYNEKINELLFAFSTDAGSLNTYKGYLISPKPDADGTETYMQEFADGARKLMKMGDSSYLVVATDYGYHFMFYSTIVKANLNYENLESYLDSIREAEWSEEYENMLNNWQDYEDKDSYLYKFVEMLVDVDTFYNQKQLDFINRYRYNSKTVKVYSSTYADLLSK
ncbi:MAG: hypothetical protein IKW33_00595 [Clostridia bacterium]|nr:hypothetical protein [Clostridia bacterium]